MKLVDRTLTTITDGSSKIEVAIGQAANEIASEVSALPDKVMALLGDMAQSFQAIALKLAEIPAIINPLPIVAPLPNQIGNVCEQIKQICTEAAQIPVTLVAQTSKVQPIASQASEAANALSDLPAQLMALAPDVPEQLKPLSGLAEMAQSLIDKAETAKDIALPFIEQTTPLTVELKSIELALQKLAQSGVANSQITAPLHTRKADVRSQIQSQFDVLRQQIDQLNSDLLDDVSDMRQVVSDVEKALLEVLAQAKDQIQSVMEKGLAPLQVTKTYVVDFQAKVDDEAQHCEGLFDQAQNTMDELISHLRESIDRARESLSGIGDLLTEAGIDTQSLMDKSIEPIDLLKETADACMDAIDKAVAVIGEQIDAVKINLDDISQEAENTKSTLRNLPEEFNPVREYISTASDEIDSIKSKIPGFVSQALGALSAGSSELEQADALCDNAIDICTRHMATAPPLAISKGLFQGAKAGIVTLQKSITSAVDLVTASGTSATALMDQAQALVLALNPLLDQVLEKLQQAIDALIGLLAQLQKGIETAKSALDAILDTVLGSVRLIREQLDGLLDSVHEQAQAYLEKIQLQPLIDDLLDKLDEIAASIFDPIDEKINKSSGTISTFVKDSKSIVSDAVTSLRSELDKLIALLDEADEAGQSQVGELDVLFEKIQGAWSDLESKTNLQIDNTSAYMDQLIDQTLSDSANQMGIQWPAQT